MDDPVVAADGFTYERSAIEDWFTRQKTSPKTGQDVPNTSLTANLNIKAMISTFRETQTSTPASVSQNVSGWTVQQVADWLAGIGRSFSAHSGKFVDFGVNGKELLSEAFDAEYLEELGVTSKVQRSRILREINELKLPM